MSSPNESSSAAAANVLTGFLTPDDLATQLGISRRTLDRWHAKREGPARCVTGKLILYRVEAVRAWLARQEREPPGRERRRQ